VYAVKDEGASSIPSISSNSASTASAASVTGSIVQRSTSTNQQDVQSGVSNALQANPIQPVLVVDDVTNAQVGKVNLKNSNGL